MGLYVYRPLLKSNQNCEKFCFVVLLNELSFDDCSKQVIGVRKRSRKGFT